MSVLFIQTASPPEIHGTDAVFQEIDLLHQQFGGEIINVRPIKSRTIRYPRQLFGLHQLPEIRRAESHVDYVHIFYPIPYYFPFMHALRKPVIYTVTAGPSERSSTEGFGDFRKLHSVIVSSDRDSAKLREWGIHNQEIIRPGIDQKNLADVPPPPKGGTFNLLMASAPWTPKQFDTKGIDVILQSVSQIDELRLTLLWRGLHRDLLEERVALFGVAEQVNIINETADIASVLKQIHATILISKRADIIKSNPHSLIESLIAGRPVITSRTIPVSDLISNGGYGLVLEEINEGNLTTTIRSLMNGYDQFAGNVAAFPAGQFSEQQFLGEYEAIYC